MLIAKGHEIWILAPKDSSVASLQKMGCKILPIDVDPKGKSPIKDLILLYRVHAFHRKIKPDLAINYTIKFVIYGSIAAKLSKTKSIAVITGLGSTFIGGGFLKAITFILYKIALSSSYKTIFLNSSDRETFISHKLVHANNVGVLDGEGVNLTHFSPNFSFVRQHKFIFLLVARMLWDKGIGEYVKVAQKIKAMNPDVVFQLLGPVDAANPTSIPYSQINSWVLEGNIDYLGSHEDVRPFISSADCIVLPSYREGMSRALMEACAMGKPIVATDVPGCRDVIEDGVTGLLCKPGDLVDLEKQIQVMMLLSPEERLKMGQKAVIRATMLFDENIINSKFMELIGL